MSRHDMVTAATLLSGMDNMERAIVGVLASALADCTEATGLDWNPDGTFVLVTVSGSRLPVDSITDLEGLT